MGYPQFNKITIQLPLPSVTMTKAEYKDAYGIDLDTINFPKVTLLVDGNNKYPVDEIKIVSDDVLILAGGKVLTIGNNGNVSVTTGAYSVENAKPLYWHGIELIKNNNSYILFVIVNNTPTLINSVEKLFTTLQNFGTDAFIKVSGYFGLGTDDALPDIYNFYVQSDTTLVLVGLKSGGSDRSIISKTFANWKLYYNGETVNDRVNKLN